MKAIVLIALLPTALGFGVYTDPTIVELAAATPDLSTLVTAVTQAGLVETLSGDGPFTVFAPTNAAFDALPDGTLDTLLADPTGALTEVLTYHVCEGTFMAADLSDGDTLETLLEDAEVTIMVGATVMVNDATVIIPDVMAANGVVHVIDAVLSAEINLEYLSFLGLHFLFSDRLCRAFDV